MKILYVLNSGNYGGMEWHAIYLAEGMVSKGYEVHVWCPEGDIVAEFEKVGATVVKQEIRFDIDPGYICRLKKYLKKEKINIVHGHELKAVTNSVLAGWLAGTKSRIAHTHTPISEWPIKPLIKKLTTTGYSALINLFATYEIALTPSRKKVKIKEGIRDSKLFIVKNPNAIKIQEFAISPDSKKTYRKEIFEKHDLPEKAFTWGCVGRISEEKGHLVLLDAFKEYCKDNDDHYLLLVGGGPGEQEIKDKISEYGLGDRIIVTGRFSAEDKIKYFSAIDIFIHPSFAEGFGIVLIEAMVAGLPIIASDLEVFKEVGAETVTYFEKGNVQDLAQKMQEIFGDLGGMEKRMNMARERAVKLFSYENFVGAYEEFYIELMREN